ncbi:MAG TPA: DUF4349 domain-containing protein [Acidimicrobiales bacterium]
MTMLDDDRLSSLLAGAAATFETPVSGPDDILERALGRDPGDGDERVDDNEARTGASGGVHRLLGVASRHRALSVAAAIVVLLVLAGVVGTLARGPAHPTVLAGPAHPTVTRPAHSAPASTTTTTPALSANGSPQASAAAPFSANTSSGASKGAQHDTAPTTPANAPDVPNGTVGQSAKIEQTGSLGLTVTSDKLSRTITQLTALAGAYGGFVANSQTQSGAASGGAPSGSVTLQVPVQSFAAVLTRAEALGKTSGLTSKATDVTGQYVDLQSRITALVASRQQYLSILAKADTVGDVLAVQDQLNAIQSQIEQLQGQLQLLGNQTSYSTLTVTVSERSPAPAPSPLPESGLVRAWHASVGGFVTGVEGVIGIAGPLLFALLLLGAVLAGGRALWRGSQRRRL